MTRSKGLETPRKRRARTTEPSAASLRDRAIVRELGAWFDGAARDLPWRRTRDPYAIWVSEIMLQQTRVETVIPYYERFLARFPTARALAASDLDGVLAMWSGLGYYRRARQLHLAAREVTARHGGALPGSAAALRELAGIGPYTAGAIASIAFDLREALVDGNVARVLARLEGIDDDVRAPAGTRRVWAAASRLVPTDRPGRFNQALMELGATVCAPTNPRCPACPLRTRCVAAAEGRQVELPVLGARAAPKPVSLVAAVVRFGPLYLLARRPEGGLFGGMWEPPMVAAQTIAAARRLLVASGVLARAAKLSPRGGLRHVLTHRELTVTVASTDVTAAWALLGCALDGYDALAWLDPATAAFGLSTLARRVLALAGLPPALTP